MTASNPSRPKMRNAIRKEDGTLISEGQWHAIRASANCVKVKLTSLLRPNQLVQRKKTYFCNNHLNVWDSVVAELEMMQPVLRLCAAHWKAEYVLGSVLKGGSGERDKSDDEEADDEDGGEDDTGDRINHSSSSGLKRRRRSSGSKDVKRRKKANQSTPSQQSKCLLNIDLY